MTGLLGGQHVGARASELLDGRLGAAQELQVRQHLGGCRECAAAVHREQQVRAALRSAAFAAGPVPGGDLMAGLMALAATGSLPTAAPAAPVLVGRRAGTRLTAAVLGTVSLASAGALGVAALAGAGPAPAPANPSSVARSDSFGASLGSGGAITVSTAVQPGLTMVTGALTGGGHTAVRGTGGSPQSP